MLCHQSKPKEGVELPCAGAVIVLGFDSIGIRIATLQGKLDPEEYASDVELYSSFDNMMRANNIVPPKRNRILPDR